MSYRAFKRLLGETSLERKCRWLLGAGVLLVPNLPLVYVSVLSQVVNGVVLPFVLVFMLLLTNDREIMGEHVNSRGFNIVAWTTVVVVVVLTLGMLLTHR